MAGTNGEDSISDVKVIGVPLFIFLLVFTKKQVTLLVDLFSI